MKIGYQGIPGSYSEMSVQDYLESENLDRKKIKIISYNNFPSLISNLLEDNLQKIIIPVENSTTGTITRVTSLLRYEPVSVIGEVYQEVGHRLLGLIDSSLDDLKLIYSHPEALSQCRSFFVKYPHLVERPFADTASAAKFISENKDKSLAAIASARAGEIYGLKDFGLNIVDEYTNTTRFYVIKKFENNKDYKGNKISLYLEAKHEHGSLLNILEVLRLFKINMTKLNSQPIPDKPFQYGFWIEGIGFRVKKELKELLYMLEKVTEYVQIIGIYN